MAPVINKYQIRAHVAEFYICFCLLTGSRNNTTSHENKTNDTGTSRTGRFQDHE